MRRTVVFPIVTRQSRNENVERKRARNNRRNPTKKGSRHRESYQMNEHEPVVDIVRLPRLEMMMQAHRCTLHFTRYESAYTCKHNTQMSTRITGTHNALTERCSVIVRSGDRTKSDLTMMR
ncbi:hypothetical protein EVAR_12457_1 [Eumeta japonica]|uniref:Uncharacterized protein n=1 Tax=Eumeta variegata TaxID=151549 RepID=A0A4C1TPG2_EUMVA|nr:hypothetical protein EVAR_12457_1 [Eumeta japonica]